MSQTKYPACTYRVSAKAIILIDGKVLLIRENGNNWDLPGGGVEHLEDINNALKREVHEELQLKVTSIDEQSLRPWVTYDFDEGWEKPILYLVYNIDISGTPKGSANTIIGLFDAAEITDLSFEKHLVKFKPALIKAAFIKEQKL